MLEEESFFSKRRLAKPPNDPSNPTGELFYNLCTANLFTDSSVPPLCIRVFLDNFIRLQLPSYSSFPLEASSFFFFKHLKGGRGADESEKNKHGGLKIGPHQNGKLMKDFSPSPRPPESPFKESICRKQK